MRALVPLGEKSSESVPERVLPYRHLLERYTSINQNLLKDYLAERETEVEGIMLTLFNQERVFDIEKIDYWSKAGKKV